LITLEKKKKIRAKAKNKTWEKKDERKMKNEKSYHAEDIMDVFDSNSISTPLPQVRPKEYKCVICEI
jgi:hypothetical protein